MRRQSDVSLSQHYWKQRHAVTAAARNESIHPVLVFVFTPCGKGGGNFATVYFSLWLEVVFGMVIDLTDAALHQRNADIQTQEKSAVIN